MEKQTKLVKMFNSINETENVLIYRNKLREDYGNKYWTRKDYCESLLKNQYACQDVLNDYNRSVFLFYIKNTLIFGSVLNFIKLIKEYNRVYYNNYFQYDKSFFKYLLLDSIILKKKHMFLALVNNVDVIREYNLFYNISDVYNYIKDENNFDDSIFGC
tara:strand:+ start:949 stop:1425 length:477 start_codon:yes stop_codon:yes gene_type:complete